MTFHIFIYSLVIAQLMQSIVSASQVSHDVLHRYRKNSLMQGCELWDKFICEVSSNGSLTIYRYSKNSLMQDGTCMINAIVTGGSALTRINH